MNKSPAFWLKVAISVVLFITVKVVVSYTVLSSFCIVFIDAEFSQDAVVDVFYSSGNGFQSKHVVRSRPFPAGKRVTHKLYLENKVASSIRLDPGQGPGEVKLYGIRLASFYGDSLVLPPERIYSMFRPNSSIDSYSLHGDHLLLTAGGLDPYLTSTRKLEVENPLLEFVFPCVLTLFFWLLISRFSPDSFAGFSDLKYKHPSTGVQIGSLDGVRGIAALLVLASHSGSFGDAGPFNFGSLGALGVYLFFCLSGFLLARPFVHTPQKAYSLPYLQMFYLRRLMRIVPMYYTVVIITMMFKVRNPDIFRHLLFLQGDGHLWTIQQEMFFYLLLPFVMLVCSIPIPRQRWAAITCLLLFIYGANQYLTSDIIGLYGNQEKMSPFVGFFLSGVVCAYIFFQVQASTFYHKFKGAAVNRFCSMTGSAILLFLLVLSATDVLQDFAGMTIYSNRTLVGLLCSSFILLVAISGDSLLGRVIGYLPFRAIGLVGYSFYLLHPTLIGFSRSVTQDYLNYRLEGVEMFLVAGIATYLLSLLTYTYMERPFLYSGSGDNSAGVKSTG